MNDLLPVFLEMRKVAEENIFRPGLLNDEMVLVSEKTHKEIEYEGYKVGITFSLDQMPEVPGGKLWHLSVSIDGQKTPPTNEFVRPFLETFFESRPVVEIPPDSFPPELRHIRQFVSLV